ncbi:MAG: PIN domain-containing protein [Terracidiphilus sp.]
MYWDTMVFVYLLEGNPQFAAMAREAYEACLRRNDTICTSVFTFGELLVLPRRKEDHRVVHELTEFMQSGEIELVPFTMEAADHYSRVRAGLRLKAADAIHVATAIAARADVFVTNDEAIRRQQIASIPFVVGLDGKIF